MICQKNRNVSLYVKWTELAHGKVRGLPQVVQVMDFNVLVSQQKDKLYISTIFNFLKYYVTWIILAYNNRFLSLSKHSVSLIQMLFRDIITVYSETNAKHKNSFG